MRTGLLLGVAALLVVACSSTTATEPPPASPTSRPTAAPSPSPSVAANANIVVGGDRKVTVIVPPGYDAAHPAPLLLMLHGYGSSGVDHESYFDLGDEAARRGYLYAYPNGTLDDDHNRFWNATDACCDFDERKVDDASYLAGLIAEIRSKLAVDPKRVDVIGHSNGGFMANALACAHPELVAAIVSLAGATFANQMDCKPSSPVAVVEIHGTADDTVLYAGGTLDLGPGQSMKAYPSAQDSADFWGHADGCTKSAVTDEHLDIDADVSVDGSPAETTVLRWSGCPPGGAAELWTIQNGGHGPELSDTFAATVFDFFDAHPKP